MLSMGKSLIDPEKEKLESFNKFLRDAKRVNKIVPMVSQEKERTEWVIGAVESAPSDIQEKFNNSNLGDIFKKDKKIWGNNLPDISFGLSPDLSSAITASGVSGTASATVFKELVNVNSPTNKYNLDYWPKPFIDSYVGLQTKQNQVLGIEEKLRKLSQKLADEFRDSHLYYQSASVTVLDVKLAAINMRNVLEHLQGDLLELAKNNSTKKQVSKGKQWDFISENLSAGNKDSDEYKVLQGKRAEFNTIWNSLTNIAKNLNSNAKEEIKNVYVEWIDFLDTTLKLVRIT